MTKAKHKNGHVTDQGRGDRPSRASHIQSWWLCQVQSLSRAVWHCEGQHCSTYNHQEVQDGAQHMPRLWTARTLQAGVTTDVEGGFIGSNQPTISIATIVTSIPAQEATIAIVATLLHIHPTVDAVVSAPLPITNTKGFILASAWASSRWQLAIERQDGQDISIVAEEEETPDISVIRCIILVFDYLAQSLIDTGATHSFIASIFIHTLELLVDGLTTLLRVTTPI